MENEYKYIFNLDKAIKHGADNVCANLCKGKQVFHYDNDPDEDLYRIGDTIFTMSKKYLDLWCDKVPVAVDKIIISTEGRNVVAKSYAGKQLVKEAVVKCVPEDDFDFEHSAALAFVKLKRQESYLTNSAKDSHYGFLGMPTNLIDSVGRKLRVGDVVEVFDSNGISCGEECVVDTSYDPDNYNGFPFIAGWLGHCKRGCSYITGHNMIKKRGYEDLKDGEVIDYIMCVR